MPATASTPPRSRARIATGTRSPTGAKRIAASSFSGGSCVCAGNRFDTQLEGQPLRSCSSGQHVHPGSVLGDRDLCGQMGAAPETVDTQPATRLQPAAAQRPESDDARAQQRRKFGVVVPSRAAGRHIGHRPRRIRRSRRRRPNRCIPNADRGSRRRAGSTGTPRRCAAARQLRPGHPGGSPRPAHRRQSPRRRPRVPESPRPGAPADLPRSRAGRCGTRRRPAPGPPDRWDRVPAAAWRPVTRGAPAIGPGESTDQARIIDTSATLVVVHV